MSSFFSGTDTSTLEKEGKDMPNFVSLVVNNAGAYVAAVTHKVTTVFSGKAVSTYNLFGESLSSPEEKDFVKSVDTVKIYGLDVEKESVEIPLLKRFDELKQSSESKRASFIWNGYDKDAKSEDKNETKSSYPYSYYGRDLSEESSLFPDYCSSKTPYSASLYENDFPYDYTELIGQCIQDLLIANSKYTEKEARNIMRNSDYPIISIINTYGVKTNDKAFVTNVKNTISGIRFKCLQEETTWEYIKAFVAEELTNLCEDERDISKNKSWYKKPISVIKKIISIVEDGDN